MCLNQGSQTQARISPVARKCCWCDPRYSQKLKWRYFFVKKCCFIQTILLVKKHDNKRRCLARGEPAFLNCGPQSHCPSIQQRQLARRWTTCLTHNESPIPTKPHPTSFSNPAGAPGPNRTCFKTASVNLLISRNSLFCNYIIHFSMKIKNKKFRKVEMTGRHIIIIIRRSKQRELSIFRHNLRNFCVTIWRPSRSFNLKHFFDYQSVKLILPLLYLIVIIRPSSHEPFWHPIPRF